MSETTEAVADLLSGFEFVPSDGAPFITLDKQRRFYLNATTRKLLDIKPYHRLSIAYNPAEKALAIVKPSAHLINADVHASTAQYVVDKRYYLSARRFAKDYAYSMESAPYEFAYDRGSSDGNVFIFRLVHPPV